VKLEEIRREPGLGTVLEVSGADLMDGTPIYDIKPYLAYTDSHPEAAGGFTDNSWHQLEVSFPEELLERIPPQRRQGLVGVLEQDPRPTYQKDSDRVYGMTFGGYDVKFTVQDGVLTVVNVEETE
jgi:hypothetical protein